jgi:uncharacterized protein (TIGR03435 family)
VNTMQVLSSQPWVERLGWTLVHFLWQGVAITAVYAAVRRWMTHSSRPNTRYILACVALAAMVAAPLATWILTAPMDAVAVSTHHTDRVPFAASTGAVTSPASFIETVSRAPSAQFLPWVVAAWLAGAMAFWMRLIAGWLAIARVRSTQVRPAPPEWQQTLNRLRGRVGVTRPVRLLISALVRTPAVVGWLKPVVLIPIGALAGLPSEQVEALLIHELAHIRRHDYLVNILQSVAEALLFYHPAVWWVSGHIRSEREMCCDDEAVSLTGDAFTYALALADLEQSRTVHLHAAVAANGGSLANRIGRLLGQSRPASRTISGPGATASAMLLVVTACVVFGQSADSPRFEVASIKLNTSTPQRHMIRPLPGGLHTQNASVRFLMQNAYSLQSFQIVGGPSWTDSDGYDIEAKGAVGTSQSHVLLMLQSLLEDRFHLKVHRGTKELPAYALTAAKSGLKLPPPKEPGCINVASPAPAARGPQLPTPCGHAVVMGGASGMIMQGASVPMAEFTRTLSMIVGSPIIDKTGVLEKFDVRLEFYPDEATAGLPNPRRPGDPEQPSDPTDSPSILIALQQQLGLKLEATKGPVEVLVIDHVERPTEN